MRSRLRAGAERLRSEVDRFRTITRVALGTKLAASFTARGVAAVAKAMTDGGSNPALLFRIYASDRPTMPAIVHGSRVLSYADVYAAIGRVANALRARGVNQGASVLLVLGNRPEFIIAQNAAALIGAAAVSASPHASTAELAHLASHSGAVIAFVESEEVERVFEATQGALPIVAVGRDIAGAERWDAVAAGANGAAAPKPAEDAAVVVYTSGTTGKPKGAVRKFPRDSISMAMRFIEATPMRAGDVHLVVAPLYHSTAHAFATFTFLLGGQVVLLEGFSPEAVLDALAHHRVNTTAMVPTMLHRLVDHLETSGRRLELPHLRAIFSGGAALSGTLAARVLDRFGDVLFNFYGATETGVVTLATPADLRRAPGTIGRAVPGVEIVLIGEDRQPVARGASGELYAKSPLLSAGYLHDETATRAATLAGFFSVGDLARQDASGLYFLEGRKREMVISGGVNVYPIEVEHELEAHPDVREAAVLGAPDEEWGERVQAFVVRRAQSTLTSDALRAWMRERVAAPKVPRDVFFVAELPRNPTGKVVKSKLREVAG